MTDLQAQLTNANPVNDEDLAPSFEDLWRRFQGTPPSYALRRARRRRYGVPGGLALAAAVAAALLLFVVPGGSPVRPASAAAAVLSRAEAALDQPNTILYLQAQDYNASGSRCQLEIIGIAQCIRGAAPAAPSGISANPADDTPSFSFQRWQSSDGSQLHTIWSNGDETVEDGNTHTFVAYDAPNDTLTTLTDTSTAPVSPPSSLATSQLAHRLAGIPGIQLFVDPTQLESLYQQAQTVGAHDVQLVGQTTVEGEPVYELAFDIPASTPTNPPPGDICGSTACPLPGVQALVYLDSQTYTPVLIVTGISNPGDQPGIPDATTMGSVTHFTVQRLPDTTGNEALLQMSPHSGAKKVQETEAQYDRATG